MRFVSLSVLSLPACILLSGCFGGSHSVLSSARDASPSHINNKTKFSQARYGVAASPRVTTSLKVRKGGGRRQLGKPYKIKGRWYVPKEEPGYDKTGMASWYGPNFHGRLTANGEVYDQFALSGAHPTFPLPSYARVTNVKNGRSVIVRVNDRGPYHEGRIIDLSARAAELLDYQRRGVAQVRVQYVGPAPLHGRDADYLSASYRSGAGPVRVAQDAVETDPSRRAFAPAVDVPQITVVDRLNTGSVSKRSSGRASRRNPGPSHSDLTKEPFKERLKRQFILPNN